MTTRDEAYEERIAHLRTGIKMLGEDYDALRRRLGLEGSVVAGMLLDQDTERAIAMDKLR